MEKGCGGSSVWARGRGVAALGALVLVSGCASMQAQYEAQHCTHNAAYAAGVNTAKNGKDMLGDYAATTSCSSDAVGLNKAYTSGFQFGLRNTGGNGSSTSPPGYECRSSFGKEICGYNCVASGSSVRCAASPEQQCLAGGFGKIACGYNCAKSQNTVKCAQRRGNNCVADSFGNVKCGRNCRVEFGDIKCGKEG